MLSIIWQCRLTTNFLFVKNAVSASCSTGKDTEMRSAYSEFAAWTGCSQKPYNMIFSLVLTPDGLRKKGFAPWNFWSLSNVIWVFSPSKEGPKKSELLKLFWFSFPLGKTRPGTKGFLKGFHGKKKKNRLLQKCHEIIKAQLFAPYFLKWT